MTGILGILGLLGGPWGVAITAGVTAPTLFGEQQREAAARVDELTGTLDAQTGAVTDNTRTWVINELERRGVLAQAERLGVDTALVTSAVLGEADALNQLNAALNANIEASVARGDVPVVDALQAELVNSDNLIVTVRELSGEFDLASEAARRKAAAARELSPAEQSAAGAVSAATQALRTQADELRAQIDPCSRSAGS
ncbi:hypothetical protein ACTWPT_13480 [Nonomuraea sp. 3N208]|uniref:hypothetical protein n=1 Tax=Nonomuraea sp. 3N208 TaxID=3457421 RepID=UPI003FCD1446